MQPLAPGDRVGQYEVTGPLGAGGMGIVYLAYDCELDRRVALKLLRPDAFGVEEATEAQSRLVREARAMAKVSHPNVVNIYNAGTHGETVFLAMELVEGTTVKAWLLEKPRAGARSWRCTSKQARGWWRRTRWA